MRSVGVCLLVCALAACRRDDPALRRADGSMFSTSGGEVELADGSHLQFVITIQRYKQWEAARSGLSRSTVAHFGEILQPKSPTERTIDRAASYLESTPSAKQAIERTGMSVRDFVLMTVALEQEMRLANGQGATPPERTQIPPSYPFPSDTTVQPVPPAPVTPPPRVDTVRRDTVVTPPPRRDAVKRDSIKRDTLSKPPRDTSRDTTTSRSRESLLRE